MAISPKQLEVEYQKEIDLFEAHFDKILASMKISKGQSIAVSIPFGFTISHLKSLKPRYINAGWSDVTYNSDQREGDWLAFKY